ncbi:MAG: glycosyltransferase family A protein [Sporichthyaceae bacterium]
MTERAGRVSVVVPTRNVVRTLAACLDSVLAQDHPDVELIVVDNDSDDGSFEVARARAQVAVRGGPERSAQRNAGTELASGEWVMWVDSDMVLPPATVRLALATALDAGADAVSVPELSIGPGFWSDCRRLERTCYLDDPALYYPRLLRRSVLVGLGGFDATMSGPEDVDLRRRLDLSGARLAHSPAVHILHDEGRLTLAGILRKRVYYGASLPAFAAVHPGALRAQGAGTAAAFVRHRRRLLAHPVLAAGIVVMRVAEAAAYGVGYALGRRRLRATTGAPA